MLTGGRPAAGKAGAGDLFSLFKVKAGEERKSRRPFGS